jgi:hypothetical protein
MITSFLYKQTSDEKPSKKFKGQGSEVSGKGAHSTPPGKPKGKIAQVCV